MEPFASLEPEVRAFALVGYYLSGWGGMENALNRCIAKALNLELAQGVIVTHNLQFRNKIKILRTLINETVHPDQDRSRYDKFAIGLDNMSVDRNMVAHEWFEPCEKTGGVRFFVTKAHGKLQFPEVRWSIEAVDDKHTELFNAVKTLKSLEDVFAHSDAIKAIVKALMDAPKEPSQPMGGLFGLGRTFLEDHQPPLGQDSNRLSSIGSIISQTPEEPRE